MSLPLSRKLPAMEAQPATELPSGPEWHYEPKWDGFRCLAFRDNDKVELLSKSQKPLTRYFPELVAELKTLMAEKFVLIPVDGKLWMNAHQQIVERAESRVRKLSESTPCVFIVFDLLVDEQGKPLNDLELRDCRKKLESFAKKYFKKNGLIRMSPMTRDLSLARKWFHMGVGLDGIVAKRDDLSYQSGKRTGMQKIKKQRTADCVVGGFRYLEKQKLVGSLLLGLYNKEGLLDHVGFTSSIRNEDRRELTKKLEKIVKPPGFTGKASGGLSRWSTKHSMEWQPVEPKLVVEVQFDHFTGGRFPHGTKFLRWRPEKAPRECTMEQVQRENRSALDLL